MSYANETDWYGNPLFDVIIIQPGEFYGGTNERFKRVFDAVSEYNSAPTSSTKVGFEMELDMGLVTGRWDRDPNKRMNPQKKREVFKKYLNKFNELTKKYPSMPIGVYSGGPNEQGYNNTRFNQYTHNNGNHIPYGDGIVGEWYATGVYYADFPTEYQYDAGNLMYDLNEYFYNGIWKPELSPFLNNTK